MVVSLRHRSQISQSCFDLLLQLWNIERELQRFAILRYGFVAAIL